MEASNSLEDIRKENVDLERIPVEEVFELLKSSKEGLTSEEGERRLQIFGPNKLEEKKESKFLKFLGFMWNPLSWVMESAALMAIVLANGGADVHALKDAISSTVDVMKRMGSSICCFLSMVEGTNSVVSELTEVAGQERVMLVECRELLALTTAAQDREVGDGTTLVVIVVAELLKMMDGHIMINSI